MKASRGKEPKGKAFRQIEEPRAPEPEALEVGWPEPKAPEPKVPPRPPVKVSSSGKKFSVTLQVPDDVAAQWPEWFTTDRLMGEVFKAAAVAAVPARTRALSRLGLIAVGLLVVELFLAGLLLGYLGGGRFRVVAVSEPAPTAAVTPPAAIAAAGDAPGPAEPPAAVDAPAPAPAAPPAAAAAPTPAPAPAVSPSNAEGSTAPSPAVKPPAVFRVQLGAFRSRQNADELARRVRAQGYQPVIRTYGGLYLVQVGAFSTRAAAERLAAELKKRTYSVYIVP